MSGAIAVFVKTPGLSPVKTRLAVKIGKETAEAFHLASANSVAEVVKTMCQITDVQGYFAVAEKTALDHHYWQQLPCIWQGDGGLGQRMGHIYQHLLKQHDFVMLVGADIPQMTVDDLLQGSAWLTDIQQPRLTFAPSVDGGFWLVGGNCSITENIWIDVVYSQADTGAQFLTKIEGLAELKILPTLADIDEPDDLEVLDKELSERNELLPAQHRLKKYLESMLG